MSKSKWTSLLKFVEDDDDDSDTHTPTPAPASKTVASHVEKAPIEEPLADIPIPTGPWVIYYHAHYEKEKNFTDIETFKIRKEVSTFAQFWAVWDAIGDENILDGYFYIMKKGYPPIWEEPENINGGTYTLRIERDRERTPVKLYYTYAIAAMTGKLARAPENNITGVRISNKNKHNLIHIWNSSSERFNNPTDINLYHVPNPGNEVRYERLCNKRF
jgi:hypothetical protein